METFKIKAVLAAVEHKSLARAAEAYSYTPSAFSHMLSSFEAELGVQLFNRSSTGVTLTEEGKKLYPFFVELAESEKRLESMLSKMASNRKNQLRIGTFSSISRGFLSDLIKSFNKEYPHIKLYISVVDNLDGWLEEDRADIIFSDRITAGKNEWVPLMEDRFSVVAPKGVLGDKETMTCEELYEYPHILIDSNHLKGFFDESRFREVIHLISEDDLSVIKMVKQGLGLTVLPDLLLDEVSDGVSVLRLEPDVTRTIGFAYKKQAKQNFLALSQFVRYVKSKKIEIQQRG